jgi:TonB dependent receptor-like, beta-barrel/FecR, C-terminal/CarboxypepD_reg-like domain/TonB-dependent Receptor Plug Domain
MRVKLIYLCLFISYFTFAQQGKTTRVNFKNTPLTEVFTFLENQFGVHFSFESKIVADKTLNLKFQNISLKGLLKALNAKTSLIFEVISPKYIAVRHLANSDIISVCGSVLARDSIPLSGATIIYNNRGLITDEDGIFNIKSIKAGSLIRVQYLGFKTKIISAKSLFNNKCKPIILKETSEQIKTIVIKNYLTNGIDKTNSGSFLISPKKLGILAGLTEPDLFQSIQLLPGVSSPNETATGLYVRGGTPDQNLILWDGIRIYHSGHLFGAISPFNPYITKQINFINKGTGAEFGEGVSSVLDIKTSDSIQTKLQGGGGINLISADAYFKIPIIKNKFSILASGRRSFTDFWQSKAYKETADIVFKSTQPNTLLSVNNNFFFLDYNIKGIVKFSDSNYITFSNLLIENKLEFGVKEVDDSDSNDNGSAIAFDDFLETDNRGYSFNWQKKWSEKITHHFNAYYSDYYLLYNKFKTEDDLRKLSFAKKNTVKDLGLSLDTEIFLNAHSEFKMGYQFSAKDVSYLFLSTNDSNDVAENSNISNLNTHALYITFETNKSENIHLNTGVRVNYYQNLNKVYIEPRFNLGKYLTPHLRLNISGEYKTQAMSKIDETIESGLSLENELWSVADINNFPVITATQFTLGFSYVKNKWHIDIDTYYKSIKGIATLNFGFSDIFDNDAHIGRSTVKGIDFYVKKSFKNYATWLSYTYDDTQNQFNDINNNNFFPGNSNIKHNFYWSHTYKWQSFDFALGWRWHSGKPYSEAVAIVTNSSGNPALQTNGINNYNLPSYNRLDFSSTYHFYLSKDEHIKAKFGFSYLNVLNRVNILSRDYYINQNSDRINSADKISLERVFNLVFRVNF